MTSAMPTGWTISLPTNISLGKKQRKQPKLAALMKIDRSKLSATDKIAYDVFKRNKEAGSERL